MAHGLSAVLRADMAGARVMGCCQVHVGRGSSLGQPCGFTDSEVGKWPGQLSLCSFAPAISPAVWYAMFAFDPACGASGVESAGGKRHRRGIFHRRVFPHCR